jgi:hypothetical protein
MRVYEWHRLLALCAGCMGKTQQLKSYVDLLLKVFCLLIILMNEEVILDKQLMKSML